MIILSADNISKSFGYGKLFENLSFTLSGGEILSIVGPNGCGKSTLIKMIAGEEKVDSGSISIKKGIKIGYLKQVSEEKYDKTGYEYLNNAFSKLNDIAIKLKKYEKLIENPDSNNYDDNLKKYCDLIETYSALGGYDTDSKIKKICEALDITESMLQQKFSELSGGEKTILQLAKCLLKEPDLVLLDEPTNHLDIKRIEWIENYIKDFKGAILLVSHDRYLLDKVSDKILDLGQSKIYNSNYSQYLEEKEKEFDNQMADFRLQEREIKKLEQEVSYFIQKANETKSSAMFDRAKALREKIKKIKESGVKRPQKPKKISINFSSEKERSKDAIVVKKLTILNPEGDYILNNINILFRYGDRTAIVGPNGSGKSTLINSILGREDLPHDGYIQVGLSTIIGYLPQIIIFDNPDATVLEEFQNEAHKDYENSRRILGKYQFTQSSINKRVKNLSEGEKIRLKLSILLQQSINCLIFDEPTNHIDISTREVLEDALRSFDGTFIFVSHDRYFINNFAKEVINIEDGSIDKYIGNYDDYKKQKSKKKMKHDTSSHSLRK